MFPFLLKPGLPQLEEEQKHLSQILGQPWRGPVSCIRSRALYAQGHDLCIFHSSQSLGSTDYQKPSEASAIDSDCLVPAAPPPGAAKRDMCIATAQMQVYGEANNDF